MDKDLRFIDFHESLTQALHDLTRASVVREGEQTIGLVQRGLVTVAYFKTLLVPPNHSQTLLKFFYVTCDI